MLECPANYFGMGEDYVLPDDQESIREFERKFQEWETAHPEDPTGDIALALAKKNHEPVSKSKAPPPPKPGAARPKVEYVEDNQEYVELELTLPPEYVEKLKNYAKFKRRRPRDVVMNWISQFCKL